MKTIKKYHASVPRTLNLLLSVGMVAFLLLGSFITARTAQAAVNSICTTIGDGDWAAAIWDCGAGATVIGSTDDAVVVNFVTLSSDQTVHSVSIDGYGILLFTEPVTLTINGDFAKGEDAIFDPGNDWDDSGGTVAFGSGDHTITTNGQVVDFFNLTKVAGVSGETLSIDPQMDGEGGIHILNSLILKGAAPDTFLSLQGTVPGSQWGIWPEGTSDVDFVHVQDSNNVGPSAINVANGTGSGNITGWEFGMISSDVGVALTSSGSPINPGHQVTFTATITPSYATGSVEFKKDGTTILRCEAQPVVGGVATCETDALVTQGAHAITAVFTGNGSFDGQTAVSDPLTQIVKGSSATTLNVSPSPMVFGDHVTLIARVSPVSATSGYVSFTLDSVTIAACEHQSISIVAGSPTAICSVDPLVLGSHSFHAQYHSESELFDNSSSTTVIKVVKYASTVGVASSMNPSVVGKTVTLTATVSTLAASAGGHISFKVGGVAIAGCGSVEVVGGSAQCMVKLPVGNYNVTVEYTGDDTNYGSSSSVLPQAVNIAKYYFPNVGR